jgi:hypothetical protein
MTSRDGHLQPPGGRTRPGVILALVCAEQFRLTIGSPAGTSTRAGAEYGMTPRRILAIAQPE